MPLLLLIGQAFALWRTFKIEARFGFNRVSPKPYTPDFPAHLLLSALLGGPPVLGDARSHGRVPAGGGGLGYG